MKKLIALVFILVTSITWAQENKSDLKWETNLEVAKKKAKKEKKPILMLFTGSDWCPPCKKLKSDFFDSEKFKEKSNNFVLLMVDLPRNIDLIGEEQYNANKLLNKKYGISSIPVVIATDANGGIIDKIKSYNAARDTRYHFEFIDKLLK